MRARTLVTLCLVACAWSAACGDDGGNAGVGTGPEDDGEDGGASNGAGGSPALRGDTPVWPEAESEIEVPYLGGDVTTDLMVSADLSELDVHMNVDTTGSFGEEIDTLQLSLRSQIVSALSRRVANTSFGVSRFADFPLHPFGERDPPPDQPYVLLTPITSDLFRVTTAVGRLDMPLSAGGDEPEAGAEALYQIATGEGYVSGGKTYIEPWDRDAAHGGGDFGGVGFRPQALRLVLHVTDAKSHKPKDYARKNLKGLHDMDDAATALRGIAARTIAIMSTDCAKAECRKGSYSELRDELSELALRTLAVMDPVDGMCPTGIEGEPLPTYKNLCPLVFDVRSNGSGLTSTVVDGVLGLLDRLRFGVVHAVVLADPLGFVQHIEAIAVKQAPGVGKPQLADRIPKGKPDGINDTFLAVQRRERLGFRVTLRNDHLPPGPAAQRFRLSVQVLGDGVALEARTLRVVVPTERGENPRHPDAGRDAGPTGKDASTDAAAPDAASADDAGE